MRGGAVPVPGAGFREPQRRPPPAAAAAGGGWRRSVRECMWPAAGMCACCWALLRLWDELAQISAGDVAARLRDVSLSRWLCAVCASALAYLALALYDRIALLHLARKGIPFGFVLATSFTTYAISHNVGASVLSGGLVRYRAYTSVGLSTGDVAVLVAVTATTFGLGCCLVGGSLLVWDPALLHRLHGLLPSSVTSPGAAWLVGWLLVGLVAAYAAASALKCQPVSVCGHSVEYPRLEVVVRQLLVAPMEMVGAAGIIHFTLPSDGHPGFETVLGVFIASFAGALASHAPGGMGVFELLFVRAMPEVPKAAVLAALLAWRLLYLVIPLCAAVPLVLLFERARPALQQQQQVGLERPGGAPVVVVTKTEPGQWSPVLRPRDAEEL